MSKPLVFSDDLEYNTFYFMDDLLTESHYPESNLEFSATLAERIRELQTLLSLGGWSNQDRFEMQRELKEAKEDYTKLSVLNVR